MWCKSIEKKIISQRCTEKLGDSLRLKSKDYFVLTLVSSPDGSSYRVTRTAGTLFKECPKVLPAGWQVGS
jgi:hypothetical protein